MNLHRRSFLGFSAFGAGLGASLGLWPGFARAAGGGNGPEQWIIDDTSAVAETQSGTVMGYVRNGVRIFEGIPYAEILSPQDRWRRGTTPKPWAGKRSSRAPGFVCPPDTPPPGDANALRQSADEIRLRDIDYQATRPGEDCLRVNIWTPATDSKKRQVLFYLHGGGFHNGSALMALRYEAHNLARYGDVVVVNLTHRLNAFGFLDLSAHGYGDSANLGMLDIVDALKWVKANIAHFGGDPDKIMIFGQSGGGAKVLTLLGMPEAKGLFSRAIAHSSGPLPLASQDQSAALTAAFLKLVDVSPNNVEALHKLSTEKLAAAAGAVVATYYAAVQRYDQWGTPAGQVGWRAVVDGRHVLYQPMQPNTVSDVPLITGTTLHETYGAIGHPEYMTMKETEARALTRRFFGPVGDAIYDFYKSAFPKAIPYELSAMGRAMGNMRAYGVKAVQRRAALGGAPCYNYSFQWRANTFEGRAMSHHELDMPMVFLNSDEIPNLTAASAPARALALKMADSWLAFAHSGNPNTKALPHWNPVTPTTLNAMVFDNNCHIDRDSDLAAVEMFWKDRFPKA